MKLHDKIRKTTEKLLAISKLTEIAVTQVHFCETGYKKDNNIPPSSGWKDFYVEDSICGIDRHFWFHVQIPALKSNEYHNSYFQITTGKEGLCTTLNPQGLIYINGSIIQGTDVNHNRVLLPENHDIDLYCYFHTGMIHQKISFIPSVVEIDMRIMKLYYDMIVPLEASNLLDENEDYYSIIKSLETASNLIDFRELYSEQFYVGLSAAEKYLAENFYGISCKNKDVIVHCIGHTHIDVAWLWTYAETEEKVQRSFATVLHLMEQYPDYVFMSSQPVLYSYVKENAPELFEKIKTKIAEGRWEAEGSMWLESDCNLISGESFVRQIMMGKKFFKEEFGVENNILWLPDVFGFSAAMPQILKKCGIDYLVTSKMSWNDTNRFPHDNFEWEGIDGSRVFVSFLTTGDFSGFKAVDTKGPSTYSGRMNPTQVLGTWAKYNNKDYNNHVLTTFGYGDGGGGPTDIMLEYQRRMAKGIPGIPQTKITKIKEYLKVAEKNFRESCEIINKTPRWVGELYLEIHRGTYTSIAKNKRNNRFNELLLQKTELLSTLANTLLKTPYPQQELEEAWKLLLLNQFHDVLPGSSIEAVYKDSDAHYQRINEICNSIISEANHAIFSESNPGILMFNALGFEAKGAVQLNGRTIEIEGIPACGWALIKEYSDVCKVTVTNNTIENQYYIITLDEWGNIISLWDKRFSREVVKKDAKLNEIQVYEDMPRDFDNWDISEYYDSKMWKMDKIADISSVFDGTRAGIKIKRNYINSSMEQTIWLYSELERIDFETEIDWHENHQLVKAAFPVDIHTNTANYEIQYGYIERPTHQNTSWNEAMFEVCGHKWADVSEDDYGISLMNDCKYGYSCDGNVLKLTLLKSGTHPNEHADQGLHVFTYSLLPHCGSFKQAKTVHHAYELNQPLMCIPNVANIQKSFSLVSCKQENIIIDTVKISEDGEYVIVRFFECYDRRTIATITFGFDMSEAWLCDMMENNIESLHIKENSIQMTVENFEVVTLKLKKCD